MPERRAKAQWKGGLKDGKGNLEFTGYQGPFTYASRFEDGDGTNPEELIGAAHAGCFSMFLSALLGKEDFTPERIDTSAAVTLGTDDAGPVIQRIALDTRVQCPGLPPDKFHELVDEAKKGCPVSRLVSAAEITVNATLD
jgi:osmotically inducible protein OsmC